MGSDYEGPAKGLVIVKWGPDPTDRRWITLGFTSTIATVQGEGPDATFKPQGLGEDLVVALLGLDGISLAYPTSTTDFKILAGFGFLDGSTPTMDDPALRRDIRGRVRDVLVEVLADGDSNRLKLVDSSLNLAAAARAA